MACFKELWLPITDYNHAAVHCQKGGDHPEDILSSSFRLLIYDYLREALNRPDAYTVSEEFLEADTLTASGGKSMRQSKILVAIDGSKHAHLIVEKAIEYARFFQEDIILVYCHRSLPNTLGHPYNEEEIALITSESEKLLAPFIDQIKRGGVVVEERIMEEPAGAAITDIARIEDCSLIIMGSRGLTNLAGLIIGSVTNRVLQTAPCSVLVVR